MVSVLAFYSDDPSSNPAEIYNFSVKLLLKRTKINKKEAEVGPFFKKDQKYPELNPDLPLPMAIEALINWEQIIKQILQERDYLTDGHL